MPVGIQVVGNVGVTFAIGDEVGRFGNQAVAAQPVVPPNLGGRGGFGGGNRGGGGTDLRLPGYYFRNGGS